MDEQRRILVGTIGAAQGLKGEVRIKSYTGEPTAIGRYGALTGADGRRTFEILAVRALHDDLIVARLRGIEDRTAAAALTGTRLYASRSSLPPIAEDEIYHADLVGLLAMTPEAEPLGRVIGVENYGGGDLLEIDRGAGDTILVPFGSGFVSDIDLEARRLVVARGALGSDADEDTARDGA